MSAPIYEVQKQIPLQMLQSLAQQLGRIPTDEEKNAVLAGAMPSDIVMYNNYKLQFGRLQNPPGGYNRPDAYRAPAGYTDMGTYYMMNPDRFMQTHGGYSGNRG